MICTTIEIDFRIELSCMSWFESHRLITQLKVSRDVAKIYLCGVRVMIYQCLHLLTMTLKTWTRCITNSSMEIFFYHNQFTIEPFCYPTKVSKKNVFVVFLHHIFYASYWFLSKPASNQPICVILLRKCMHAVFCVCIWW